VPNARKIARQGLADAQRSLTAAERNVEAWRAVLAALGGPEATGECPQFEKQSDIAELLEECANCGIQVIDGRFVSERNAARLVGLSPFTLRNRRQQLGDPIAPVVFIAGRTHYDLLAIGVHRKSVR
jgi:hypothetical protein